MGAGCRRLASRTLRGERGGASLPECQVTREGSISAGVNENLEHLPPLAGEGLKLTH